MTLFYDHTALSEFFNALRGQALANSLLAVQPTPQTKVVAADIGDWASPWSFL
jgi:hypothetical protein